MKKLSTIFIAIITVFMLAGCSTAGNSVGANSKGFTQAEVIVEGDKFNCFFENRSWNSGKMSCFDLEVSAKGEPNTKGFTRETITMNGEKLDCIFENRAWDSGKMDCFDINA